ncbi:MAG: phosphatidate cytidylyltransferase, partial [Gammaproteobacteria bacterium]
MSTASATSCSGISPTRSCISVRGCGLISRWRTWRRRSRSSPPANGASATPWRDTPRRRPEGAVTDALRTRVVTAVVLAAVLLAILLWLPPWATVAVMALLVLAGAWEWSAFLLLRGVALRAAYVLLVAALLLVAWRIAASAEWRRLLLGVAVLWWLIALLWIAFAPRRVSPWSAAAAGVLALVPAWVAMVRLRRSEPQGAEWVLFAFVLVWVADIGAFFFGRRFGRVRLAPEVSPGKTWEGVLGGIALSALVAIAGSRWFHVPLAVFLPLCLTAVAFSIIGDLTESLLKRFAGLKDSGRVFPGHGG